LKPGDFGLDRHREISCFTMLRGEISCSLAEQRVNRTVDATAFSP